MRRTDRTISDMDHVVSLWQFKCKGVAISILDILKPPFGIRQNRSSVLVVPIRRCSVNSAKAIGVKAIAGSANRILARDLTSFVVLRLRWSVFFDFSLRYL
jgi:hypothetical protein